jgi:HSP20 family protein
MTEEIDTTIASVEKLYRAVSGRAANGVEVAPIPPERDAGKHVDEQLDKLLAALATQPRRPVAVAPRPLPPTWAPPVSVFGRRGEVLITVDLPGVTREHVTVAATPLAVVVSGRRALPFSEGDTRVASAESPLGAFRREILLPGDVDVTQLTASLKDGVLELRAPRSGRPATRSIEVQ